MKGFVFTTDALFASFVSITIALSFYLVLAEIWPLPASVPVERELLSALEKSGRLSTVTGEELSGILLPYNRCGSLELKSGGSVVREAIACPCAGEERGAASRGVVLVEGPVAEYCIATLKTCLK